MKRSPELELRHPAHSADPQRGAAGHPAELMREERGIGCDHDDDGARILIASPAPPGQRSAARAESGWGPS